MTQLRMLYSSNAFWAGSGYGIQGKSLLPRLAVLPEFGGRDAIAMFAWYGLQGGVREDEGFRVYPVAGDPYGNDVIGAHSRDHRANLVVSLIDVWVMRDTAKAIAPALWCVPGDTLITLNDGHQLPIKDLYDMKGNRLAMIGHDGERQVEGLITGYHYMGIKPTLELETMTGRKLRTTAESGVYVKRNGDAKYIPAASVIPGDMVYCTAGSHAYIQENNNDELGARTHDGVAISIGYSGDRTGVLSGDHRWRGSDQCSRPHKAASHEGAQGRTVSNLATSGADLQHGVCADSVVAGQDWIQDQQSRQAQSSHQLSGGGDGLSNLCHSDAPVAVLDRQEATGSLADGVHGDSRDAFGYGTQPAVRTARGGNLADTSGDELEEVRSVRSTGVLEPVYDLTTSTHNFYANGMLIHNCPWLPIDHDPVPQAVLRALEGAHLPLTYAKWGRDLLTAAGVPNHYIPHGVETDIYKILADRGRVNQHKHEMLGMDDAHLTVMVAANKGFPDRKAFQVQLRAWAEFAKTRPKARLYIHTEPSTQYGGIDFAALIGALGINGKVLFPDRYRNFLGYPQEYLSLLYNMADVFLGASMSEGFGIPIIEAQACGTPVIVTDFSAMPELVRWGVAVKQRDMMWTPMNSWQAWPDHEGITAALVRYYTEWMDTGRGTDAAWVRQSEFAQKAIHDEYDWDTIVRDQWAPLVRRLAGEAPALCESEAVAP